MMHEQADDALRPRAGLELGAGPYGVMQPAQELGEADRSHGARSFADLGLVLIAVLDLPATGANEFEGWTLHHWRLSHQFCSTQTVTSAAMMARITIKPQFI